MVNENSTMKIPFIKLDKDLPTPSQSHEGDAAVDLYAREDIYLIAPGRRHAMPTGIAIEIPSGYAGFITPRSGVSAKRGIGIANAPGIIDSGYRGELKVILINNSDKMSTSVKRGDKIAQLTIVPVFCPDLYEVSSLTETDRGEDGFGSTGF